jgi:predicted dehydrogenase
MAGPLRAVVIGAGWAGEGHVLALRHGGAEVVALCARQPDVVQAVAARLGVPQASTDWRRTLQQARPDVVTLATPASLREEAVDLAADLGCHILCEKPLAATAPAAGRLLQRVEAAGVKHAYGATQRYGPSVAWLAELVGAGAVGPLRALEGTFRQRMSAPLAPWTWADDLASGGGLLNNGFTHWAMILQAVVGGPPLWATGTARPIRDRAPVVPGVHDFRRRAELTPSPEAAAQLEWRACDADFACAALFAFAAPDGRAVPGSLLADGALPETWPPNGWRFYGDDGVLVATGAFTFEVARRREAGGDAEPLPVPERLRQGLPQTGQALVDKWAALTGDFLADVRGGPHRPYPTFLDGWRVQAMIDAIRAGRSPAAGLAASESAAAGGAAPV